MRALGHGDVRGRAVGSVALALAVFAFTPRAPAHAPPQATGIWWADAEDASAASERTVVRTNRGLLVSSGEQGESFRFACSEGFEGASSEVLPTVLTRTGVLVATYRGGLLSAWSDLCAASRAALPVAGRRILDLTSGGDGRLFALAAPSETELGTVFTSDERISYVPIVFGLRF